MVGEQITTLVLYEISVMLIFAVLGYMLSKKTGQPVSVGIIFIGVLLGPSVFGLLSYNETIAIIARIGSIILLFLAGLSVDYSSIYNKKALLVGIVGGLLPFAGGAVITAAFGFDLITSIFVGATLTATCLGITSALLREMGKMNTETAKLMLGAAVVDDVVGLLVLSVVSAAPSFAFMPLITKISLAIIFLVTISFFGIKLVPRIVDVFDKNFGIVSGHLTFTFGMGIVFGFSYIAEAIGLAAILGAFLAGVCLSNTLYSRFFHHGGEYLEAVFTSMFFIAIGIVVELTAIVTSFWLIVALSAVAIATKLFGCGFAARKCGMNRKDSLIVGVGMAPRGEVAFIIALFGLSIGVISREIYSSIVFVSFITTVITLVALKRLYGK